MPFFVMNFSNSNTRDILLSQLNESRAAAAGDSEISKNRKANNLDALDELFYPNLDFDGFKLYCVEITKYSVHYYYAPTTEMSEEYLFTNDSGIEITIRRPEWVDSSTPLKSIREQFERQGTDYKVLDNSIWDEANNCLIVDIGNTWLSIRLPEKSIYC